MRKYKQSFIIILGIMLVAMLTVSVFILIAPRNDDKNNGCFMSKTNDAFMECMETEYNTGSIARKYGKIGNDAFRVKSINVAQCDGIAYMYTDSSVEQECRDDIKAYERNWFETNITKEY